MSDCTFTQRYLPKGAVTQQIMELPRDHSGAVEWNTLGNILVAHALGEVVCASYIDRLYGRASLGFEPDTDWRFFYKEKNVVVLRKQMPDSPIHCYMGRTVVDLPTREIFNFLAVNESAHHFYKYIVESKLVKCLRDETYKRDGIGYMRHEAKHCLVKAKRDFVFYVRWEVLNDGKCVMSTLSIDHPDCPPIPGVTQGQIRPGSGWVLEPYQGDPNRTLVTNLVHVDFVGLPPLVINRVVRREPLSVHYLKEYLLRNRRPSVRPSVLPSLNRVHSSEGKTGSRDGTDGPTDVPTTPDIPTPARKRDVYCSLSSSLPMESNPLYQSSMFRSVESSQVSLGSNKESHQDCSRSRKNTNSERFLKSTTLVKKQVSVVPEENEEAEVIAGDAPRQLIEVEVDIEGLPMPFEFVDSIKPTSGNGMPVTKDKVPEGCNNQEKWLLMPNQLSSLSSTQP